MDPLILLVGFGEPPEPDPTAVEAYLERIFLENMDIEDDVPAEAARERAAELAKRRLPGLLEEYEEIGGSPLQAQLQGHADRLTQTLNERGLPGDVAIATQYFDPSIPDAVEAAHEDGTDHVIILPMYPLCGPSTTVAAIASVTEAIEDLDDWEPTVSPIGGWHRHPRYNRLRVAQINRYLDENGIDLEDDDVELVFSAHGTPVHYLEAGSRYEQYVEEYCETQSSLLGIDTYTLGYQNHESRGVEWTQPDIETAVEAVDAEHIVVDPVSFIHEQSETLSELDIELAEEANEAGLAFDRVPVPHDNPVLAEVLADLVEPLVAGFADSYYGFRGCQCSNTPGTRCLCAPLS